MELTDRNNVEGQALSSICCKRHNHYEEMKRVFSEETSCGEAEDYSNTYRHSLTPVKCLDGVLRFLVASQFHEGAT